MGAATHKSWRHVSCTSLFRSLLHVPAVQKHLENEPIPLVIVEGFLGGAGALIWGNFEDSMNLGCERPRRVLFAKCVLIFTIVVVRIIRMFTSAAY
jgi:hypothetical protein